MRPTRSERNAFLAPRAMTWLRGQSWTPTLSRWCSGGTTSALPAGPSRRLFLKFARRHVPEIPHALEFESDWAPENAPSRTTYRSHAQTIAVSDRMSGETRRARGLVFGTGLETGALMALTHAHLLSPRVIVAPGSKNSARRDRTILMSEWAAAIFSSGLSTGSPSAPVFSFTHSELRKAFYRAQVDLGMVSEPKRSSARASRYGGMWSVFTTSTPHVTHTVSCAFLAPTARSRGS